MPKRTKDDELGHELDDSLIGLHPDDLSEDDDDPSIEDPDSLLEEGDEDEEGDDDDEGDDTRGSDDDGEDDDEEDDDDDDESVTDPRVAALEARVREQDEREQARLKQEAEHKLEAAKSDRASKQKTLESKVEDLTERLEKAHEDGETKSVIKLQQELIDARVDLRELSKDPEPKLEDFLPEDMPDPKAQEQQQQVPEPVRKRLSKWLKDNQWFHKDRDAQSYAIAVGDRLAKDGYDPATKAYYAELDKSMKKRFPELYSKKGQQRREPGDAPGSVAGRGRAGGKNRGNKRTVRVGKSERQLLETFGLDSQDKNVLKQYGRVQRGGL